MNINFETARKEISRSLDYIDGIFPGTQPVSLDYTNIQNINENYYVSLKYDGVRQMLYSKSNISVLFDRKYNYKQTNIISTEKLTILDGEEIDGLYIIFDCIVLNGTNIKSRTLTERIEYLKCFVQNHTTITLNIKNFYPLVEFTKLLKIKDIPCDGYIFTNIHNKYTAGRDETLYKYKDGKNNTIDFACYFNGVDYELYCGNLGRDVVWIGYGSNAHNLTLKQGHKHIIESYWDDESQMWVLKKHRHDKINSNDIKIVRWNIRTIENNIKLDDLISLLSNRFNYKVSHVSENG